MAEYIERQAVIDLLKGAGEASGSPVVDIELTIEAVQNDIPAADVEEVRHGHWMYKRIGDHGQTNCSVCGKRNSTDSVFENPCKPYCPNCGATMDEEDEQ